MHREACAVLDAVGWRRPKHPPATVEVPITPGFPEQLLKRRYELGHANLDRWTIHDAEPDPAARAEIKTTIAADRDATITLDDLIAQAIAAF